MTNASSRNSSSSNESFPFGFECIFTRPGFVNFFVFYVASLLLISPVCVLVLNLGFRQWWQQRSTPTAAIMGHSDVFIYHLVIMELIAIPGFLLCIVGIWVDGNLFMAGFYCSYFPWTGEGLFHILTCVERYLAVVHPTTYLSLRRERGIRVRNMCIGCAWLFSVICVSQIHSMQSLLTISFILVLLSVLVVSFCSVSVLYILIRPGPGEKPSSRGRFNQSKIKAFYIVMVILGVVLIRMLTNLSWIVILLEFRIDCRIFCLVFWVNLPCTLVLPLLFLQRSGTFKFCLRKLRTRF